MPPTPSGTLYHHTLTSLLALDEYAIRILSKYLSPKIPRDAIKHHDYFNPFLGGLPVKEKGLFGKNARYLEHNLIFGRSIQKMGTLLFCLAYAQEPGSAKVGGVWQDVKPVFAVSEMANLYTDLKEVNTFRNTRVAHVETKLDDPDEAWKAMRAWLRCLGKMAEIAG